MECEIDYGQLSRHLAGDLQPEAAESVEAHLEKCADCRRRLADLRRVDAELHSLAAPRPPARAVLETRRAIARELRGGQGPEIMTLEEVAEFLRVTPDVLAEVLGELPAFEVGGKIRVRRAKLVEWVEARETAYARERAASEVSHIMSRAI